MNRRKFFGMTAAAIAAAGLPAWVLPEKTVFLAPKYGWKLWEVPLGDGYIRMVRKYSINTADYFVRYDVLGINLLTNTEVQYCVETGNPTGWVLDHPYDIKRQIERAFERDGIAAIHPKCAKKFRLELPASVVEGKFL